jgi:3-carboxy-cis,cis-muconate cycloisomerase
LGSELLVLHFGVAPGTLAALGDKGLLVAEALAWELKLPPPDAPWHTHRDRIAEVAAVFASLCGSPQPLHTKHT